MAANWKNRTLWTGDNLDILRGMNSETVDLIYLDPPFNSNQNYAAPIGSEAAGAVFKDTWTLDDVDLAWHGEIAEKHPALYAIIDAAGQAHSDSMKSYLIMMAVRLLEMQRVLKPTGSIYLHCDPTASHYLKMEMDCVFGRSNFQSEIIWKRTGSHNRAKRWGPIHDTLLFYSMGPKFTWNRVLQPLDPAYVEKSYRHEDAKGRYQPVSLLGPGSREGDTGMPWRHIDPATKGRHWELPPDRSLPKWFVFPEDYAQLTARKRLDILDSQCLLYWPKKADGVPRFKMYLGEHSGSPVQDIVLDIRPLAKAATERVGYPTQKPLALLDRIIKASSKPGDMVFDPFCGCATACVSADSLDREWIGIDISPKAADLVKYRLRQMGFWPRQIHHRTDIPQRTDQGSLPHYRTHKHTLFGKQEGHCNGCRESFPFRNFTIDHIVPKAMGGTDHLDNLQLLCGACNSMKGARTQEELIARLRLEGIR